MNFDAAFAGSISKRSGEKNNKINESLLDGWNHGIENDSSYISSHNSTQLQSYNNSYNQNEQSDILFPVGHENDGNGINNNSGTRNGKKFYSFYDHDDSILVDSSTIKDTMFPLSSSNQNNFGKIKKRDVSKRPMKGTVSDFFFGFMYEEEVDENIGIGNMKVHTSLENNRNDDDSNVDDAMFDEYDDDNGYGWSNRHSDFHRKGPCPELSSSSKFQLSPSSGNKSVVGTARSEYRRGCLIDADERKVTIRKTTIARFDSNANTKNRNLCSRMRLLFCSENSNIPTVTSPHDQGRRLKMALCTTLILQTIACTIPVTLTTQIGKDLSSSNHDHKNFASSVASASVLGIALGKLWNGPTVDIFGARRTSIRHSILLCTALLFLAMSRSTDAAIYACFLIEFANSVQWPCAIVLLATHTRYYSTIMLRDKTNSPFVLDEGDCINDTGTSTNFSKTYEDGILVTSLASRFGSLIGIPLGSYMLLQLQSNSSSSSSSYDGTQNAGTWRYVALFGAWISLVASSVTFHYVKDSPTYVNQPQNPVDANLLNQLHENWNKFCEVLFPSTTSSQSSLQDDDNIADEHEYLIDFTANNIHAPRNELMLIPEVRSPVKSRTQENRISYRDQKQRTDYELKQRRKQLFELIATTIHIAMSIVKSNIVPSLQKILCSGVFWILAFAHTGASMVRTSERIIGTYLYDTSDGTLTPSKASGLSVFLSIGIVLGLLIGGKLFANTPNERERKWFISRLYILTIVSIYLLAVLAIPAVRIFIHPKVSCTLQVITIATAGFGISVQSYHIPSIIGATFARDHQGLFASYVDGVAYGLASAVWRIVGSAVSRNNTNDSVYPGEVVDTTSVVGGGLGWAYGWAAVALLVILSGILMVEFIEHYLCRTSRRGGSYETIIFA